MRRPYLGSQERPFGLEGLGWLGRLGAAPLSWHPAGVTRIATPSCGTGVTRT